MENRGFLLKISRTFNSRSTLITFKAIAALDNPKLDLEHKRVLIKYNQTYLTTLCISKQHFLEHKLYHNMLSEM